MPMWVTALLLVCAVVVRPALADDREKLIGIWQLVSWEVEFQDTGERRAVYGANPLGYLILTPEGRMMAVVEGDGRKTPHTEAERATAFQTMIAYSGTYRVEGDRWITKVDATWNPAWRGTDQARFFKFEGDRLSVLSIWQPQVNFGGRVGRGILSWQRWTQQ
jgi:hypothetical protein